MEKRVKITATISKFGGFYMKKRITAVVCALILLFQALPAASALEGEGTRAANLLAALNLIDEAEDYAVGEPATRIDSTKLLVRLAGGGDGVNGPQDYAIAQGWVTVTSGQKEAVTADEFCASLFRVLGYKDEEFPVETAATYARHIGMISKTYTGSLTRSDLFQIIRDVLTFPASDGAAMIQKLIDRGACTQATANALGLFDKELTARQVADRYMSAVFCIRSYASEKDFRNKKVASEASGFFVTADGLAVTNHHTIDNAVLATATLVTGETYSIDRVLYYDADIDIALVRVNQMSVDGEVAPAFATLDIAGTEDLRPGDVVYTLGNPLGLGLAVSSGIVSDTNRDVESYALPMVMNTADISQGSSGGALLNIYGRVTGVTSGAYTYGNNMYLAVPVEAILDVDWTVEGQTLAEATAEFEASQTDF